MRAFRHGGMPTDESPMAQHAWAYVDDVTPNTQLYLEISVLVIPMPTVSSNPEPQFKSAHQGCSS
eukprot:2397922-Amphidinium_carterae.1